MSRPDPKGMGDITSPIQHSQSGKGERFVRMDNGNVRHVSEIEDELKQEDDGWLQSWGG